MRLPTRLAIVMYAIAAGFAHGKETVAFLTGNFAKAMLVMFNLPSQMQPASQTFTNPAPCPWVAAIRHTNFTQHCLEKYSH